MEVLQLSELGKETKNKSYGIRRNQLRKFMKKKWSIEKDKGGAL